MVALKAARVLVGSFVFSSWAVAVQAQTCEKNEDCPQGFTCYEETATSDCPPVAPCDGAKDCPSPPSCGETVVTHACRPANCETDADCGGNMVCYEHKSTECAGGTTTAACAPNEECAPAEPVESSCTEKTEKTCAPRYVLPCQEASDCGDGFTCEPNLECTCSGSGGVSPTDPGSTADAGSAVDAGASTAAFVPVSMTQDGGVATDAGTKDGGSVDGGTQPPVCECHPLETKHCAAKAIKCQSDAECPSDFSCVSYASGSVDCAASKDADAAVCGVAAPPPPDDKLCAPRYVWADWAGGGRGAAQDSGGSVSASDDDAETGKDNDGQPPTHAADSDAGVAQDAGATPAGDAAACSVTTPGAHTRSGFVVGFVMLVLGLGRRARKRGLPR